MGRIRLAHGAGGVETLELLKRLFFNRVEEGLKRVEGGVGIDAPDDGAAIPLGEGYLVVTVDSYTVLPEFFPGGDIGLLAAAGTINDVVMAGGRPIAFMDSIVVPEGYPMDRLDTIVNSMLDVLRKEGVPLIGGDLKVVPSGALEGVVITGTGLGVAKRVIVDKPVEGDKIVVTGPIGAHGAAILAAQHGMGAGVESDVRPLTGVLPLLERLGWAVNAARDPTRGGLAMTLFEWAEESGTVIVVEEASVPLTRQVRALSDMFGIDPYYLASEGVAAFAIRPEALEEALELLRKEGFAEARVIGEVRVSPRYRGVVLVRSRVGGYRILEPPRGVPVPRIC